MTKKTNEITAYKGFDQDLKCRDFQYEIGKTYKHKGEVMVCNSGFHACENPLAVFEYYPPTSRFARVKCAGKISKGSNSDKEIIACEELTVEAEIGLLELISEAVEWIPAASNTGNYSAASNTGNYSAASNTGYKSVSSSTGYQSVASSTGYQSVASNIGYNSVSNSTGYQSVSSNAGNYSAATSAGNCSVSSNTGINSRASSTGFRSVSVNAGLRSEAEVSGLHSVACALGEQSKAKAAAGGAIVCVYRNGSGDLVHIRAAKVGENGIKADTWYTLDHKGEFTECE